VSVIRATLALLLLAGVTLGGSTAARAATMVSGFSPISVTFVSPSTGWVLGTSGCRSGRCLALRETTRAGRSWSARALPPALLRAADRKLDGNLAATAPGAGLNIRFADLDDGWLFGNLPVAGPTGLDAPELWDTHDGGRTWHRETLAVLGRNSSILDLEAAAGRVHLMVLDAKPSVAVESSTVSRDRWRSSSSVAFGLPAGGGELSGAFVLHGVHGWLVEGNDRGTTGSAQLVRGRWVAWTPPCSAVGAGPELPRRRLRDRRLCLTALEGRSARGDRGIDLALCVEERREVVPRRAGARARRGVLRRSSRIVATGCAPDREADRHGTGATGELRRR
jgi:hypothetical protein